MADKLEYKKVITLHPGDTPVYKQFIEDYARKITIAVRKVNDLEMRCERHGYFGSYKNFAKGEITITFTVDLLYAYEYSKYLSNMPKYITDRIMAQDIMNGFES